MSFTTLSKLNLLSLRISESAPLKTHKYFRIAVPQAMTGQTLVQLLHDLLQLDDNTEALHLATLLLQYGYIFPVIEQSNLVRDDNTLYRIQLPYYWPSHATHTDNVEYAIYLNKRLLRNEQKHGLEEDEVEAYNKLVELLGHMWNFIQIQAEMQLKLQKEKKKQDKVVYDSEERAFWRSRRPGVSNCLEQHVMKQERKIRKNTIEFVKQTIERFKFSIKTKPWLKALKASETMVTWCEQFQDYDPFITTSQPSNPWISDDITLWAINADSVDVPTERRVKRWGLSVQELVRDPIGRQVLETHLETEFSSENIRFWIAIQDIKYSANSQVEEKAQKIHDDFLAPGAPYQVNVDSKTLDETLKLLKNTRIARRHAFWVAEEHVFTLMSKDSYPRFIRSQIYKGVLSAAQQQGSRRLGWRNFVFNVGNQKKINTTGGGGTSSNKHKASRDDTINNALPKQLSSDSLPLKSQQNNPQRFNINPKDKK
uniref:G protein signaling regulator EAT-16 (projected from Caenorhabditis elegans ortholog eat-16) n=1 Tax=Strongyloides venezuelensis TaxID=75913 RepID=A0A0K0FY43_STRVS